MLHFAENMQITHLDYSELSLLEDCIFKIHTMAGRGGTTP